MAITTNVECYRGEAVTINWQLDPAGSISGWTMTFELLDVDGGTVILSRTVGSGITVTAPSTGAATITLTATHTNRTPGAYFYSISRTNSGNETVLSRGAFIIRDTRVGS